MPGRLGLTGSKGKAYQVTKDEVKRRLAAPEKLSASALCQYLKVIFEATLRQASFLCQFLNDFVSVLLCSYSE